MTMMRKQEYYTCLKSIIALISLIACLIWLIAAVVKDKPMLERNKWRITAYCACEICCEEYADGITASGLKAKTGMAANNWLEFGTVVFIDGIGQFVIQDRGSSKYFGKKAEKRKAIDVYMENHRAARYFGIKYRTVTIID